MPRLSVIIVNWNSKEHVRACLRSLEHHCTVEREVIVVDGASFDGCGEMLGAEFPAAVFIQSHENLGFGRCNNLGLARATGDYVLFLNPDTEVSPGAVEALLEVAMADSSVGLVGARLLNSDGSLQTSCVQALPTPLNRALDSDLLRRWFPRSGLWGTGRAFASDRPIDVPAVSGACMLLPRHLCLRIGGFCPDYFMYAEDMHLCWDVTKLGKRIVHHPGAEIVHHGGGATAAGFSRFACTEMAKATHHFIRCRQGAAAGFRYRLLTGGAAVVRLGSLHLLSAFAPGRLPRLRSSIGRWRTHLNWALRSGAAIGPAHANVANRSAASAAPLPQDCG